jgi:hypothetical protein
MNDSYVAGYAGTEMAVFHHCPHPQFNYPYVVKIPCASIKPAQMLILSSVYMSNSKQSKFHLFLPSFTVDMHNIMATFGEYKQI